MNSAWTTHQEVDEMKGYCYSCNNKYTLRKCVAILNRKNIRYRIYDEYLVTEKPVEDFHGSKYYTDFIGQTEISRFTQDEVVQEVIKKSCIVGNDCELRRGRVKFILILPNRRRFEFKRIKKYDWIFDKVFVERKKDFFEFNFNQIYVEDENAGLELMNHQNRQEHSEEDEDSFDVVFNEDEALEAMQQEAIANHSFDNQPMDLCEYEMLEYKETFRMDNVFNDMTTNQAAILGLTLLKVSAKAISILMKTSPTYILLERKRIVKKIKRLLEREIKYGH